MSDGGVRSAQRVVETLSAYGVRYLFGVPGAKIDSVFDALRDSELEVVVCRHEQNAAFMAAAVGRLTGTPGAALVTSGPGTTNLATGLVTATTEQDPMVAICGAVTRADRLKRTHQSMDAVAALKPFTKYTGEVTDPDNVPETVANAIRAAVTVPRGAAAVVLPADVSSAPTTAAIVRPTRVAPLGAAPPESIAEAAKLIRAAERPVLFVGLRVGDPAPCAALRALLAATDLPVVETFQAAGVVSRELENRFVGRVGLFRNQPGDILMGHADVLVTIGFDPVEYDPRLWNTDPTRTLIHIDEVPAEVDNHYQPTLELRGNIAATLTELTRRVDGLRSSDEANAAQADQRAALRRTDEQARNHPDGAQGLNPAAVVLKIRDLVDDDATIACDVGSHYIYMARHVRVYQPRRLLFSDGQQTLGVALPRAMAAAMVRPGTQVVSVSGDGGFLFSAQELETATRLGLDLTHVIMRDNSYDMVGFQEVLKYGRTSGVELADYDVVHYAKAFGAKGIRIHSMDQFAEVFRMSLAEPGVTLIDVPVDYSRNIELFADLHDGVLD
ncbi:acetolactate synthase AlsS [Mycobacterium marinum]|uniref:acetolactate synthase AlsS n=1 Tax=Mycobacterium marinum TaxID=1781 RepID=UPI000E3CBF65|nr:acetolactate synthase AlsS [Mycobacterium marinum]MDC8981810.1 acetolactate synthase AlsS [Mycobacterium marinum]MDC8993254.1 acetolactate synthase AlsS [Mycobacterium marinum]MDC8998272.1 acetolactate synthase AlsS [Mycobacterium marinum]MDC9009403.1 acetolactate synthase AlsS [Mycobacterium marinum]QQW34757.1 acetolactate synthase AlsS [Mycobacterium marinum]